LVTFLEENMKLKKQLNEFAITFLVSISKKIKLGAWGQRELFA
jgi:hypothetical protein